jgi:hypothetical protein
MAATVLASGQTTLLTTSLRCAYIAFVNAYALILRSSSTLLQPSSLTLSVPGARHGQKGNPFRPR